MKFSFSFSPCQRPKSIVGALNEKSNASSRASCTNRNSLLFSSSGCWKILLDAWLRISFLWFFWPGRRVIMSTPKACHEDNRTKDYEKKIFYFSEWKKTHISNSLSKLCVVCAKENNMHSQRKALLSCSPSWTGKAHFKLRMIFACLVIWWKLQWKF